MTARREREEAAARSEDRHGSNTVVVPTETIEVLDRQAALCGLVDRHAFLEQLVEALEVGDLWSEVRDVINAGDGDGDDE